MVPVPPPRRLGRVSPVEAKRLGRTVLELRERDLSYPAIAAVLDLYEGHEVTGDDVRAWLRRLGAPTNPRMARPRRDSWVEDAGWPLLGVA